MSGERKTKPNKESISDINLFDFFDLISFKKSPLSITFYRTTTKPTLKEKKKLEFFRNSYCLCGLEFNFKRKHTLYKLTKPNQKTKQFLELVKD